MRFCVFPLRLHPRHYLCPIIQWSGRRVFLFLAAGGIIGGFFGGLGGVVTDAACTGRKRNRSVGGYRDGDIACYVIAADKFQGTHQNITGGANTCVPASHYARRGEEQYIGAIADGGTRVVAGAGLVDWIPLPATAGED